ncbi:MAG: hypothetical protein CVU03_09095 [Bacteroidetes bacterium HGW-Bacteroidetes-2]|jgi:hypothetical protein|nr:MAG: hypothetical protein CVU03_09095 [Bacteroidetes bacterium HGW-Bacteroidetes-2]
MKKWENHIRRNKKGVHWFKPAAETLLNFLNNITYRLPQINLMLAMLAALTRNTTFSEKKLKEITIVKTSKPIENKIFCCKLVVY